MGRQTHRLTSLVMATAFVALFVLALPGLAAAIELPPGAPNTISGFVRDTGGHPLACIVEASHYDPDYHGWDVAAEGFSSADDGSYVIAGLPAGTYRIEYLDFQGLLSYFLVAFNHRPQVYKYHDLSFWEWWNLQLGDPVAQTPDYVVVPPSGPGPSGINGSLSLVPASISGHVHDASGTPVAGVSAILYGQDYNSTQWHKLYSVPVEDDGSYAFRGLTLDGLPGPVSTTPTSGPFKVGFSDETSGTYDAQYFDGTQSFVSAASIVCTGVEQAGVDATLTQASLSVTGTVVDAKTRAPLGGILVTTEYVDDSNTDLPPIDVNCRSHDDGTYELRGLTPGREYQVVALGDEMSGATSTGPGPIDWVSGSSPANAHFTYEGTTVGGVDFGMDRKTRLNSLGDGGFEGDTLQDDLLSTQFERGYADVADVVVTPSDDKAAADAVSAPGLCWAYQVTTAGSTNLGKNAPLIALPRAGVSLDDEQTVADIGLHNGTPDHHVTLHVVGTLNSVPDAALRRLSDYAAAVGVSVRIDRLVTKRASTRYDVAAAVAMRMRGRARASSTDAIVMPGVAFLGNGEKQDRLLGTIACSAVSAGIGAPVLPVTRKGTVPKPIARAFRQLHLNPRKVYIAGDTSYVSEGVRKAFRVPAANRIQGPKRGATVYTLATALATKSLRMHWLRVDDVAIAGSRGDALAGGATFGDLGGVLLLASGPMSYDDPTPLRWVSSHRSSIGNLWFVNDAPDHSEEYAAEIWGDY